MTRTRLKTERINKRLQHNHRLDSPEGAGSTDVEVPDVVAAENFLHLLDPLVLGVDGEVEPRGPGDGDNFFHEAVDVLLIQQISETR